MASSGCDSDSPAEFRSGIDAVEGSRGGGEEGGGTPCTGQVSPVAHDAVGAGTVDSPFEIYSHHQLADLAAHPASWASHFVQCNDIDLWPQYEYGSGEFVIGTQEVPFSGSYDGQGFDIIGLRLEQDLVPFAYGLFGWAEGAHIESLTLVQVSVDRPESGWVGAMIGYGQDVTLIDVGVELGSVTGLQEVGGLAGELRQSTVDGAQVGVLVSGGSHTGGLAGRVYGGLVENATSRGDVQLNPEIEHSVIFIGGLVGALTGQLRHCEAHGDVLGDGHRVGGGLVGAAQGGNVDHCFATGDVTAQDLAGGLVGSVGSGTLEWSYATGQVTAVPRFPWSVSVGGGLTGGSEGLTAYTIHDCYATGDVHAGVAGGLVAHFDPLPNALGDQIVERCYASGHAEGTHDAPAVGPVAGAFSAYPDWDTPPAIVSSFSVGTASGPGGGVPFSTHAVAESCFYNEVVWPGADGNGAQPASSIDGHFSDPNAAPMVLGWTTGGDAWDFAFELPRIPSAGVQ
ncbi:MAG: GLUG motif-containing protein [Myxococcota bacterium]